MVHVAEIQEGDSVVALESEPVGHVDRLVPAVEPCERHEQCLVVRPEEQFGVGVVEVLVGQVVGIGTDDAAHLGHGDELLQRGVLGETVVHLLGLSGQLVLGAEVGYGAEGHPQGRKLPETPAAQFADAFVGAGRGHELEGVLAGIVAVEFLIDAGVVAHKEVAVAGVDGDEEVVAGTGYDIVAE